MKKTSSLSKLFLAALIAAAFVGCSSSKKDTASTEPVAEQSVAQNTADSDNLNLGASSAGRAH